ncbi:hypothetical protein Val02_25530 [Virgisporangium aliadipatigenens]|uniref:Class F sortase n=1 Tax=Virgisporangium aliadipatigenens TaxID=741659 RepID=A0A8J3YJZ3_9ACTN|nr:class F sortase [Virgisporangium aliadipatigenens]GIJ45667.1 hypothetical protein Val02_25530 [Virgisporangium aliadipatigenens]
MRGASDRRAALAACAAGGLLLVAAAVVGCGGPDDPPDTGAGAVSALASATAVPPSAGSDSAAAAPEAAPVPPVRLRIADLGIDAAVAAVGVASSGQFEVPASIDTVGWYRFGPGLEATAGSIVIAGHVDSAERGKGAFFALRTLAVGATVEAAAADGTAARFRVVARETYEKRTLPLDRYFARDGAVRMTLITCGGPFDARTRSYRDNVVITAELVR